MHVGAQGGALARPAVAEDQPVRLGVGVEPDRREVLLVDAEQQPPPGRELVARPVEQVGGGEPVGQQPELGPGGPGHASATRVTSRSRPSPSEAASGSPSIRGRAVEEVQPARHQAAAGLAAAAPRGQPAVDLGVHRVAEPQLEPGAEQVADRGAEVGPARRRGDQVDAVREAARGQVLELGLQVLEVGPEGAPAVDDQEHVAVAVVGTSPRRAAAAVGRDRVDAVRAEVRLAAVDDAARPRRRSGVRRRARTGWRPRRRAAAPAARRTPPPPKSRTKTCDSGGCRGQRQRGHSVRSSVLLPLRGPPTTATWPPAPDRSTVSGSRRCSRGWSTMPTGTVSRRAPASVCDDQAARRVRERGRAAARRGCRARPAAAARPGAPAGRRPPSARPPPSAATRLLAGRRGSARLGADRRSGGRTSAIGPRQDHAAGVAARRRRGGRRRGAGDVAPRLNRTSVDRSGLEEPSPGRAAARRRRARRAPPATPARRRCAGRSGRTGGTPARAAAPPPAAARRAAGAARATGRAGRSRRTGR